MTPGPGTQGICLKHWNSVYEHSLGMIVQRPGIRKRRSQVEEGWAERAWSGWRENPKLRKLPNRCPSLRRWASHPSCLSLFVTSLQSCSWLGNHVPPSLCRGRPRRGGGCGVDI